MKTKAYYKSFFISGFTYYNGPLLTKKLKLGKKLKLVAESENRYDENAVAIYFKDQKLGFIPKEKNYSIAKFLNQGHNPFKAVIQQIDTAEHPERQYRVAVYINASESKKEEEIKEQVDNLLTCQDNEKLLALKTAIEEVLKN